MIHLDASCDAPLLHSLESQWHSLSARCDGKEEVKRLARAVMAHRQKLFDESAEVQAASAYDHPPSVERIESNALAIKRCTTLLSDMNFTLGRASIPARE